ncbi:MAG: Asp-tRNA(Asn)/Glu-tRNA(Gln) amidotransferase subunit GatA [Candidatus Omnitrophica bacterium]|nr:Glutamyl-tRNA(Gln) amidotransferase subunit A [bacterium]NUN94961.1 Asp-tRNA(Asn)/Glu-tRNA(Gln) amidotransferase subunit GatA [Candidatus Omnitrophota bacterium]
MPESAVKLAARLRAKEISAREVMEDLIPRLEARNRDLNAYVTLCPDQARKQAEEIDNRRAKGEELSPWAGLPIGVKDVICTQGIRTTCSSRMLETFVPPYDATVVRKLKEHGFLIVGKTNMDEFAMGSSTENSAFFTTRNPADLERVPGGSSGGSAAAAAAGIPALTLGSDTGGSIRQPAAFCGCVGLKPTYGRVSRYGLIAFASSLDQIGPFAQTVEDTAMLLGVLAGQDPMDATSIPGPVPDYLAGLHGDIRGTRIGIPGEYFAEGLDPEVRAEIEKGIKTLEGLGCEVVEVNLPHTEYGIAAYYFTCTAEASSNLARYDGVVFGHRANESGDIVEMAAKTRAEGFGAEVKRRIMLGTYVLSSGFYDAYYLKAQRVRTLIKRDFEKAFGKCDLIVTPTTPTTAFKAGEKTSDPLEMYLSDVYTTTINLAGVAGLSVPCGKDSKGLPVGMQIISPVLGEENLLQVAHQFQLAHAC